MQLEPTVKFILNKLTRELPAELSYHNIEHIQDVYNAATYIGQQEGITTHQMQLLLTAAAFHDAGYLKGNKDHEAESCRIAAELLPAYGYNSEEIDCICGMIMATCLPQNPQNHLEQILADADLDYLGRDDYFTISQKLFTELQTFGAVTTTDEWNLMQVRFMESHRYFTQTALTTRQAKKETHIALVKAKIK